MTTDSIPIERVAGDLRRHPFLAGLDPRYIEALAEIARPTRFAANHVILEEGQESTQLYLITSGRVVLEITGPGQPFRVDTLVAGDEFGWSWALGHPGVYQVRTLDPVEAITLSAEDLGRLCEEDAVFGYALMRRVLGMVAERLQATRLTVIDMHLPAAKRAGA